MFACGIPVFFMETTLGQYTSQGGITSWRKISPLFEGRTLNGFIKLIPENATFCACDVHRWALVALFLIYIFYIAQENDPSSIHIIPVTSVTVTSVSPQAWVMGVKWLLYTLEYITSSFWRGHFSTCFHPLHLSFRGQAVTIAGTQVRKYSHMTPLSAFQLPIRIYNCTCCFTYS